MYSYYEHEGWFYVYFDDQFIFSTKFEYKADEYCTNENKVKAYA